MSIETNASPDAAAPSISTEPVLVPVLSSRWALGGVHLAVTAAFCALIVVLNHLPLRNTDLWGHVVFGDRMLAEHRLPTTDPMQPLSEGIRVVDVHWLSQVALAAVDRLGDEALVGFFTVVVGLAYVLLGRTFYLQTNSPLLATLLTGLVLVVGWNRVATIRPENFAVLLFATLLWLLIGRRVRRDESVLADDVQGDRALWFAIPAIGLLWANLHGSFPVLIATLGCFFLGRVVEVAWNERSLRAVLLDREVRRQLYWCELAFAATLVNPYGIDAWITAVQFASNPNLRDILEWNPLILLGPGGREFAVACVVLAFAWRHSRRTVAPADVLMLVVFGLGAVLQIRMTGWFAFVWGIALAPHLADLIARQPWRRPTLHAAEAATDDDSVDFEPRPVSYRYTLGCISLLWITFAFTTFSRPLLGGALRSAEALYGESTPLRVSQWLATQPLDGQAFNPSHWGDWLGRTVPQLRLFATTNVHLLPKQVWNDYQRIARADGGWDVVAQRYAIRTMIVDRANQPTLARVLRSSADWILVYDDDQASVFRQRKPSPSSAAAPAAKH